LTPAALSAGGAPHAALPALPPGIGVAPAGGPPRPPLDRTHYGTPYEDHLDTAHFTINWAPGAATRAQAEAAGEALERAWEAYAAAGWPAPVSSDTYFLWVLLDPELGGTGLTAEYYTDEYPQGYPVIWLNPLWAEDAPFFSSLASHELHHAVQFAMRETWAPTGESWMWEATAGWASWQAEPDTRAIDYTIAWYADDAHLAAETMNSGHEYVMAAFTQHLELTQGGPDAVRALWEAGATDLVFLTGDSHSFWANQLADGEGRPAGVEIGTAGVTSPGDFVESGCGVATAGRLDQAFADHNPEVLWTDNLHQGYVRLEFSRTGGLATYLATPGLDRPGREVEVLRRYRIDRRSSGLILDEA
jgi:hypothetical protein